MSSLNSFRKKRELSKKDLIKRKNGQLKEFKRILIVTEGSETEPLYFEQIKRKYKLKDNVIFIYPAENSSPRDVLKTAKDKNSIDDFDKVFCVFDKDTHDTYDEVVLKITNDKKLVKFTAVTSVPCFEFWLILHYKATAKPYYTSDKNKASKNALKDLQKIDPMYSKNNKNYFDAIAERIYRFDEVRTVYLMSGSFDLLVIIEGKSLQDVANFVATRLSTIEGVTQTRSHFMLKPYKKDGIIIEDKEQDRRLVMTP